MGTIASNGIINLMRGDSFSSPIYINEGTKLNEIIRPLESDEKLYFALMEPCQAFEDAVFKKCFDCLSPTDENGNTLLIIDSEETERLLVGKYYYMIKLRHTKWGKDYVRTIVPPTQFFLEGNNPIRTEELYYESDKYKVNRVVLEGAEVVVEKVNLDAGEGIDETPGVTRIILDGGEIT